MLDWKPDKVLLVVMTRTDEDYEALKQLGRDFHKAGIKPYMFDEVHDPASVEPGTVERALEAARAGNITVIEVGNRLASAPDRANFICLDRIHMKEPYHRLMAKEWLKFLAAEAQSNVRRLQSKVYSYSLKNLEPRINTKRHEKPCSYFVSLRVSSWFQAFENE